ncbi:putative Zn(II)2Cys6 transcription factor [Aspergillus mulundensis]|uniref:Putative Zn(II)2Cys6 transcription factor n=1 Tax=Aspergillus mulundensis TaxID=1810919 RepID=A0A3D8R4V2_9EURO|nr:putative Zn(II)2Cys6 transcription factor [Aspergillus mulundensis]RDW68961.1 putative Zn(II)2Cys6 transcription factor [Aspergillus mulundensis]
MPTSKSRPLVPVASDATPQDAQRRRKNVGTACTACKARKLKCTGAPPCTNCLKSRVECTLDESADKRRRGVLKRKIDELGDKEDLLVRLLEFFRERSQRSTIPLLNLIRNHASPAEIRFYIDHELPRSNITQIPELLEMYGDNGHRNLAEMLSNRRILDVRKPSDVPRFSVPARPWTSIVDDDDLVSRLISLWFTWAHPIVNFIDRDLFIRDMQSGSLSASYCSPFLVNIILSDACAYSSYSAYGLPDNLFSLRTNFYAEAKRLFEKEEGRISLPTLQGLEVLWMCASITGRDRQAWIIGGQLLYSLRELLAPSNILSPSDPDSACMAKTLNHTNWGIFNLAIVHGLLVKKAPEVAPPCHPPASVRHQCENQISYSHPIQSKNVDAHTLCLFNALCDLNRVAYKLGPALFSPMPPRFNLEFDNEKLNTLQFLSKWPDQLPGCLQESNVNIPHVLSLHMHYHTIMTAVYGLFRGQPVYMPNPSTLSPSIREAIRSPAHALSGCLSSARKIAQLTLVHRSNWGSDRMTGINVPYIMAALFSLVEGLDYPVNRDAFISLVVAAGAFSRRWPCTKGYLRNLQSTAQQRKITLPAETGPFFLDLEQF